LAVYVDRDSQIGTESSWRGTNNLSGGNLSYSARVGPYLNTDTILQGAEVIARDANQVTSKGRPVQRGHVRYGGGRVAKIPRVAGSTVNVHAHGDLRTCAGGHLRNNRSVVQISESDVGIAIEFHF